LKTWNFGFVHQVLTYTRRDNGGIIANVRPFSLERFLRFSMLAVHGRDYLSEDEYRISMKQAERDYFSFLGKCACARHPESHEFWEFHRNGLASVNRVLDWRLLSTWIPRAMMEKAWTQAWGAWDRIAG
jgi:hypothetical protein